MAKQSINIGTSANDGTGSTLREAFDICNDNFTELYGGTTSALGFKSEGNPYLCSLSLLLIMSAKLHFPPPGVAALKIHKSPECTLSLKTTSHGSRQ